MVAAIVTYNPQDDVVRNAQALVGQVDRIVVIDNASGPASEPILERLAAVQSVQLIRNSSNEGLASALNGAAQVAIEAGAEWLLTLDQDAIPGPDIVSVAAECFEAYPQPDRIGVIGSRSTTQHRYPPRPGRIWTDMHSTITSGSFVSLPVLQSIGGYRDDFFIDYVDFEYCLRAREKGFHVLLPQRPAMTHEVGRPTDRKLGWRVLHPTNHSADRRYYITRNRILVWRRYHRSDLGLVIRDVLAFQKETAKVVLVEDDRLRKVRAILGGMMDGARGVTGPRRTGRG